MESILKKIHGYLDTFANTNYQHKQKDWTTRSGNPNPTSPNVSQRNSSTKNWTQGSNLGPKNSHSGNSVDGGDEKPPKGNIGKTHIFPVALKRKRDATQQVEIPVLRPEDMEIDDEEEEFYWDAQILLENREINQEMDF